MSERDPQVRDDLGLSSPARFTRETLLGCLGIACVLLVLPLLWVALGSASDWVARMTPLAALALAATGFAFMLRVPGSHTPRSRDPRRPLTRAGAPPVVERPASFATRASYALAVGLGVLAGVGYLIETGAHGAHMPWGLALSLAAGVALLAQALLVYGGLLAPPALRWQRLSITGAALGQGAALAAVGFVAVSSSLLLAMLEGFTWGAIGLTALFLILVGSAPLFRRAPDRGRLEARRQTEPDEGE